MVREVGFQYYQFFSIWLFILQMPTEYTLRVRNGDTKLNRKTEVLANRKVVRVCVCKKMLSNCVKI